MDVWFATIICSPVQVQGGPAARRGEELPLILPGKLLSMLLLNINTNDAQVLLPELTLRLKKILWITAPLLNLLNWI